MNRTSESDPSLALGFAVLTVVVGVIAACVYLFCREVN